MQDFAGSRTNSQIQLQGTKISNCKKVHLAVFLQFKLSINTLMPPPSPLTAGQQSPPFSFIENGIAIQSVDINSPHLVYFYPKDNTPGCTKEACAIRDAWSDFEAAGLKVIGVSKDSEQSHLKFQEKYTLPFPLIADTELKLANAFGVFGEKKFMGRTYDGIHRISFLIAANGTILKTYPKVKPTEHAAQVLEDLSQLLS